MKRYKFVGNSIEMEKTINHIVDNTITLNSHDLFLTGAKTTMFSKKGRYLYKLPEFRELSDFVNRSSKEFYDSTRPVVSWANVYPTGSYIRPHNHIIPFRTMLSSVYYLKGDGCLHFETGPEHIEEGTLVIFEGSLMHWSEPHKGPDKRIIVGFDMYYGDMSDEEFGSAMINHERFMPTVDFSA